MVMVHSVETLNKALKECGAHGVVIGIAFPTIDRSLPARQIRRAEYNGLKSLPFYSKEQIERLKWLEIEVVEDNHFAFREANSSKK